MKAPITWQAPEYYHRDKSADWYWAVGIIALSAAATAIILDNVIFGILIVIATFSLMMYASRRPLTINVEINERGIKTGKMYYPYTNLDSFWVEENHAYPKILLKSKNVIVPHIVIHVEDEDPDEIRDFLREHLTEEEQHESLIHLVMEYLGF
jgi:hypothetical protein